MDGRCGAAGLGTRPVLYSLADFQVEQLPGAGEARLQGKRSLSLSNPRSQ